VAPVITDVSKKFLFSVFRLLVTANVVHNSPIFVILMIEVMVRPKHRFLHEPRFVTSQKAALFLVTVRSGLTTNRVPYSIFVVLFWPEVVHHLASVNLSATPLAYTISSYEHETLKHVLNAIKLLSS
jgi:hypothetical protein